MVVYEIRSVPVHNPHFPPQNGLYKSVTIYAGSTQLDSITITPTENRRLPRQLGPLRVNTKSDKVTIKGEGLMVEIRTVDGTGLRVTIEQESTNTGLLGKLGDLYLFYKTN